MKDFSNEEFDNSDSNELLNRYRLSAQELLVADNQCIPQLMGTAVADNGLSQETSSPRVHMDTKFKVQKLTIKGGEPKTFYTGIETQVGKHNVGATMPSTGTVLKVIPLYKNTMGKNGIKENPQTLVIYEEFEDEDGLAGTIRSVIVKKHHTDHKTFGFEFKLKPIQRVMREGEVLSQIPSIHESGQYCTGVEAVTAFMSLAGVTEDGILISDELSKKMTTTLIGKLVLNYGDKLFPLNTYGNHVNYKPHPDIGDKILPSGLVMALRAYNPLYDHITMSKNSVSVDDIDYENDRTYFGLPNATVIDVRVIRKPEEDYNVLSPELTEQADIYFNQNMEYYKEILDFYYEQVQIKRKMGAELILGHEFNVIVCTAMEFVGQNKNRKINGHQISKKNVKYTYNKIPLDTVRVEIIYALDVEPTVAYKMTNDGGGKAVCVAKWPKERMPVNADGVHVDAIMDNNSIIKRINLSVFYEHFMQAVLMRLKSNTEKRVKLGKVKKAWLKIEKLYKIISPLMARRVGEVIVTDKRKLSHLESIVLDKFYIWLPTHSPNLGNKMLTTLRKEFDFCYGPVSYIGNSGERVTTKKPVLVGKNHFMLLNKIGDGCSAVTGAKLQHHGLPAKLNSSDRNLSPSRKNPIKFPAEAEIRAMLSACDGRLVAELCDRSNSPYTNQVICRNILTAENPSNIQDSADRKNNPFGGNRALKQSTHGFECMGIELTFGEPDGY